MIAIGSSVATPGVAANVSLGDAAGKGLGSSFAALLQIGGAAGPPPLPNSTDAMQAEKPNAGDTRQLDGSQRRRGQKQDSPVGTKGLASETLTVANSVPTPVPPSNVAMSFLLPVSSEAGLGDVSLAGGSAHALIPSETLQANLPQRGELSSSLSGVAPIVGDVGAVAIDQPVEGSGSREISGEASRNQIPRVPSGAGDVKALQTKPRVEVQGAHQAPESIPAPSKGNTLILSKAKEGLIQIATAADDGATSNVPTGTGPNFQPGSVSVQVFPQDSRPENTVSINDTMQPVAGMPDEGAMTRPAPKGSAMATSKPDIAGSKQRAAEVANGLQGVDQANADEKQAPGVGGTEKPGARRSPVDTAGPIALQGESATSIAAASDRTGQREAPGVAAFNVASEPAAAHQQAERPAVPLQSAHLPANSNVSALRIGLQTEAFGRVTIHTSSGGQQLSTQISIENEHQVATLASHVPELERTLAKSYGMNASVSVSGGQGERSFEGSNSRAQDETHQRRFYGAERHQGEPGSGSAIQTEGHEVVASRAASGRLDITI